MEELPRGAELLAAHVVNFAPDDETLCEHLPGTEAILGWNFRGNGLQKFWHLADQLKWIQWCGAGVDGILFPDLVKSNVVG